MWHMRKRKGRETSRIFPTPFWSFLSSEGDVYTVTYSQNLIVRNLDLQQSEKKVGNVSRYAVKVLEAGRI